MSVLQSQGISAALFGGAATYTRTGLSALTAGQGVIVFASSDGVHGITGVSLGTTGTPTALAAIASAGSAYVFAGTVTGSEGDTDIIVTASGVINDDTVFGALVVDQWESDQSGADIATEASSAASWDVGPVTPPTALNLVVVGATRPNRDYTGGEDTDFTYVSLSGVNTAQFGYIVQASATAQNYAITPDVGGFASIALVAFAGVASGSSSVSPSASASVSPSSSVSASLSPSASLSQSSSVSPSIAPLDAIAWGEAAPDVGEESVTWQRWQDVAGYPLVTSGDSDWGAAAVAQGAPIYGPVTDTGDASSKTFTAQANKYGSGTGTVTIAIRGSATPFDAHDNETVGPSWATYTAPTVQTWRYVQLRLSRP